MVFRPIFEACQSFNFFLRALNFAVRAFAQSVWWFVSAQHSVKITGNCSSRSSSFQTWKFCFWEYLWQWWPHKEYDQKEPYPRPSNLYWEKTNSSTQKWTPNQSSQGGETAAYLTKWISCPAEEFQSSPNDWSLHWIETCQQCFPRLVSVVMSSNEIEIP